MAGSASRRAPAGQEEEITPFGSRLRRLREAAGLTQEELASRAGLSARAISVFERGERKRPDNVRSPTGALDLSEDKRAPVLASVPMRNSATAPATDSQPNLLSASPIPPGGRSSVR